MARFQPKDPKGFAAQMREIGRRNEEMIKLFNDRNGPAMLRAGSVIANRAKEILTENGHIVTGTLRRSITTGITRKTRFYIVAEVGTFVEYAPYVEALPDGGYLNRAFQEKIRAAQQVLIDKGLTPVIKNWGRA